MYHAIYAANEKMTLNVNLNVHIRCRSLRPISQAVLWMDDAPHTTCSRQVSPDTWRHMQQLRVAAKIDNQYDGPQQRRLSVVLRRVYEDGSPTVTDSVGAITVSHLYGLGGFHHVDFKCGFLIHNSKTIWTIIPIHN